MSDKMKTYADAINALSMAITGAAYNKAVFMGTVAFPDVITVINRLKEKGYTITRAEPAAPMAMRSSRR